MSRPRQSLVRQLAADKARPDTAADVSYRIAARAAGEQAVRERAERFPQLTAENAGEALAWQESRLRELMAPVEAAWRFAQSRTR